MRKKNCIASIGFALLGVIFFLPFIQSFTGFMKEKELRGYFRHVEAPEFSWSGWFDRSYQDTMELHLKDSIPLKASFVRLRNQVDYSLFSKIYARDVYIGKSDQFFRYTEYFIYGGNYPGDKAIEENVKKLKRVQEKLKEQNKELLFVIAADKIWYYEEYLPEGVMNNKSGKYYETYVNYLKKYKCDFIDFNHAFIQYKDTVSSTLFAKGGYHWSEYSGYLAMDSIASYLRNLNKFTIDEISSLSIIKDNNPIETDQDMYEACNLQFKLQEELKFSHPKLTFRNKKNKTRAIICGDSFCNAICYNNYFTPFFSDESTYWYYNREIYDSNLKLIANVGDKITPELLEKSDIYIVLFSAGNLEKFEYGFLNHFEP